MPCYDVYRDRQVVGQAELTVHGLYYRVRCRCEPVDGIVKLVDRCKKGSVEIGICAPMQDGFGIDRRIPVKALGEGAHEFLLTSGKKDGAAFYRISREEPCQCLQELAHARFALRDGIPGLLISPQQ